MTPDSEPEPAATVTVTVTAKETVKVTRTVTAQAEADTGSGSDADSDSTHYADCTEARAAGAAPIHRGEPGYASHLDRDNDGVAYDS
ncbi:excalibur calcium-binding domain-containing protein [Streptomyces canus]|uniref:excalibur calcium-binding domain-containing protein n=1 Tax=Streptomyces canus TaxID=58343 RepID=UPI0030E4935F